MSLTADEYGEQFSDKYGSPLTNDEGALRLLAEKATRTAAIYESWGNSVLEYQKLIAPFIHEVIGANRELLDIAGAYMRSYPVEYHYISPEIDFRTPEQLRTRGDIVDYHMALLGKIGDKLEWKNTDSFGIEEVMHFPIYYDIWIQAVLTQENVVEVLQTIERGY